MPENTNAVLASRPTARPDTTESAASPRANVSNPVARSVAEFARNDQTLAETVTTVRGGGCELAMIIAILTGRLAWSEVVTIARCQITQSIFAVRRDHDQIRICRLTPCAAQADRTGRPVDSGSLRARSLDDNVDVGAAETEVVDAGEHGHVWLWGKRHGIDGNGPGSVHQTGCAD